MCVCVCVCVCMFNLPRVDSSPHPIHTIMLRATDPEFCKTPFGEINIPEPKKKREKER